MFLLVLAISTLRFTLADWDVGVAHSDRVELIDNEGRPVTSIAHEFANIYALSYDPIYGHLYFSDSKQPNATIFRTEITRAGATSKIQPLVKKSNYEVLDIAHDPVTSSIFWTTAGQIKAIMTVVIPQKAEQVTVTEPEILHLFKTETPHGLTIDSCTGYIYWTNCDTVNPSIELSKTDGSQKSILIKDGLFLPRGLTLSQSERMLYWFNFHQTGHTIERFSLDKRQRQTVYVGRHQQPIGMAVGLGILYWTDDMKKTIWSITIKQGTHLPVVEPRKLIGYDESTYLGGIVAANQYENLVDDKCRSLIDLKYKIPSRVQVNHGTCLHGIQVENGCKCASGYSGTYCEISSCHNYCLHDGICSLTSLNEPVCSCSPSLTGARCEVQLCPKDTCLNGGDCVIDENLFTSCSCKDGFHGKKCELTITICQNYCKGNWNSSDSIARECLCDEYDRLIEPPTVINQEPLLAFKITSYVLSGVLLILVLVVILLTAKVLKLRGRPRLIRRYQVTPRKPSAGDQCEIAIENCCNMNICETPCYEPEFRTPGKTKAKKEEKRTLINNEVQPECSRPVIF